MGMRERRKGAAGERELFARLRDLGINVERNLGQTRDGGSDSTPVPGWSIECKRWGQRAHLSKAIEQAEKQAEGDGGIPVVMYRLDRGQWRALPVLSLEQWAAVQAVLAQGEN